MIYKASPRRETTQNAIKEALKGGPKSRGQLKAITGVEKDESLTRSISAMMCRGEICFTDTYQYQLSQRGRV